MFLLIKLRHDSSQVAPIGPKNYITGNIILLDDYYSLMLLFSIVISCDRENVVKNAKEKIIQLLG